MLGSTGRNSSNDAIERLGEDVDLGEFVARLTVNGDVGIVSVSVTLFVSPFDCSCGNNLLSAIWS